MGGTDSAGETLGRGSGETRSKPEDALPEGVVTFVLTDIEGSTEAWDANPADMSKALARHETVSRMRRRPTMAGC